MFVTVSSNKCRLFQIEPGLAPLNIRITVASSNTASCVTSVTTVTIAPETTSAVNSLLSTVVVSDTGIDFQNRTLRSLRSACRASRA